MTMDTIEMRREYEANPNRYQLYYKSAEHWSSWCRTYYPAWSPDRFYKLVPLKYLDVWKAYLDGELQVLTGPPSNEQWKDWGKVHPEDHPPAFSEPPHNYRRKPEEEESPTLQLSPGLWKTREGDPVYIFERSSRKGWWLGYHFSTNMDVTRRSWTEEGLWRTTSSSIGLDIVGVWSDNWPPTGETVEVKATPLDDATLEELHVETATDDLVQESHNFHKALADQTRMRAFSELVGLYRLLNVSFVALLGVGDEDGKDRSEEEGS